MKRSGHWFVKHWHAEIGVMDPNVKIKRTLDLLKCGRKAA